MIIFRHKITVKDISQAAGRWTKPESVLGMGKTLTESWTESKLVENKGE